MEKKNIFERLAETHPDAEIWWDSSPLVYSGFCTRMLREAPQDKHDVLKEQFQRMYNEKHPEQSLFRGVTTNPPLSLQAIEAEPDRWSHFVDELIRKAPGSNTEQIFWQTYKEIVRLGAAMYVKVFEASGGRYGYISGQVDPRDCYNYDRMIEQALDLASLGPNVMIKCPGTREGYRLIQELTGRGIATNNTLSFVLPQFLAAAEAVRKGLETARANKVPMKRWRSVITHMTTRFGHLGDLEKEAREAGINISESDIRWAELAIFKKAHRLLKERGYPSKMLICSMRLGPDKNGIKQLWHLQKLAGAAIVFTCPPPFIERVLKGYDDLSLPDRGMEEDVPEEVLEKLLKISYFRKGYEEDGLSHQEFNEHPALKATAKEFSNATEKMVAFVRQRLAK